jgi:hypothetical protein
VLASAVRNGTHTPQPRYFRGRDIARLRAARCRTAFFVAPHHAPCLLALADVEVTDLLLALARHETQASQW